MNDTPKLKTVKPDCYKCKYRRTIPGSAHTMCGHPDAGLNGEYDPFFALMDSKTAAGAAKLGIVGDPNGIRGGWFIWPVNFDPVWLVACNGFTLKD
jgi:hypothetical protein